MLHKDFANSRTDAPPVHGLSGWGAAPFGMSGRRPYPLGRGGATPLGAVGYVRASLELAGQLLAHDMRPAELWPATGSCGTQAGLVAGTSAFGLGCDVVGVTASRPVAECVAQIGALAAGACALIGARPPDPGVRVLGGHIGPGYGLRCPAGDEAADLVARTEGVHLDPIFAAKAMAALRAAASAGHVPDPVIFLVSGGAPTLFSV